MTNEESPPNPLDALANTIESLLSIDPVPLSEQDIPENSPGCMVPVDELGGDVGETWREMTTQVQRGMDDIEYTTEYLDISDPTERLSILSQHKDPILNKIAHLKIEYHTDGAVEIKSMVERKPGFERFETGEQEETQLFICNDLQSISREEIRQRREIVER